MIRATLVENRPLNLRPCSRWAERYPILYSAKNICFESFSGESGPAGMIVDAAKYGRTLDKSVEESKIKGSPLKNKLAAILFKWPLALAGVVITDLLILPQLLSYSYSLLSNRFFDLIEIMPFLADLGIGILTAKTSFLGKLKKINPNSRPLPLLGYYSGRFLRFALTVFSLTSAAVFLTIPLSIKVLVDYFRLRGVFKTDKLMPEALDRFYDKLMGDHSFSKRDFRDSESSAALAAALGRDLKITPSDFYESDLEFISETVYYPRLVNSLPADKIASVKSKQVSGLLQATEDCRNKKYAELNPEQQKKVVTLNRVLIEILYPEHCPKYSMRELPLVKSLIKYLLKRGKTEQAVYLFNKLDGFAAIYFEPEMLARLLPLLFAHQLSNFIELWNKQAKEINQPQTAAIFTAVHDLSCLIVEKHDAKKSVDLLKILYSHLSTVFNNPDPADATMRAIDLYHELLINHNIAPYLKYFLNGKVKQLKHNKATNAYALALHRQAGDNDLPPLLQIHVEKLWLNSTRITDRAIANDLKYMDKLKYLYLNKTKITDLGVAGLKALPNLIGLSLNSTNITDASLLIVKEIESLRFLSLKNTRVSEKAIAMLRAARPDLIIIF